MSIERVKAYFAQHGMEHRVREFEVSSATVELAAAALGCDGCRIAKSLSFMVEGKAILMISEELPELIGMSDRILIMKDGRVEKEFLRGPEATEQNIINYMI